MIGEAMTAATEVAFTCVAAARQRIERGPEVGHDRETLMIAQATPRLDGRRATEFLDRPRAPAQVAQAGALVATAENAAAVLEVLKQAAAARGKARQAAGIALSAQQKEQWRHAKGRAAKLRLLRGWLWDSGADISLHELARRLEV